MEDTTDVLFTPQMKQMTAKHNDSTFISLTYKKFPFCDFVTWAGSFIRSKNFTAKDAGNTVEKAKAIDSEGNVPVIVIEGTFKAKNIAVRIKGDDLHTVLSLRPGHEDACTWQHSRIVNSQYRQIIRWGDTGREIFSVG